MKKRFTCLVLLLIVSGSALGGIPLHMGENECAMDSMMDMDCCKAARLAESTPEVATAKLCCALNCGQEGSTTPPGYARVNPSSLVQAVSFTPFVQPPIPSWYASSRVDDLHDPPGTPPAYLRNLALLI